MAIQYNPNDVAAYINRALAYNDLGMYNEALNDLNILLQSSYPVNQAFYFSVKEKAEEIR
jgi:regulator of sirC expression with transglutaminase-like and TPR domain